MSIILSRKIILIEGEIPKFHPSQVWFVLSRMDTNKATVPGDFPAELIKLFAAYLAEPLCDIFDASVKRGQYPKIYKFEVCSPVPKIHPPKNLTQLRNISGLLNFDKIYEKLLATMMISDMEEKMDPFQYGNQRSIRFQRCLIKMVHRILRVLDNSRRDIFAVVAY